MVDNSAGAAVTAQDPNVAVDFPKDVATNADVASDKDSQASDPAELEADAEADANAETGEGEAEAEAETDADGESDAEKADTEQKRNKVDAKTRIKQLSAKAREADARAAQAEAREQRLAAQLHKLETRERPGEAVDYETDAAYAQALVADAVAEAKKDALKEAREEAAHEKAGAQREAWLEKSAPMRQRAPDFETVATNPNLTITHFMKDAITGDDHGPEVIYYLGKNPEVAARIAGLSPLKQASEIGRLAERLGSAPQAKKVTQATAPRKTLQGHGSPAKPDVSKMDNQEYRAFREKQMAARRGPK